MKQVINLSLVFFLLVTGLSCNAQTPKNTKVNSKVVTVYYFHYTHRCVTCNTVEKESKEAVKKLYPQLVSSGKVVFKALNLDDASTTAIAKKCKATGQSLLIISGSKRVDLTNQAFMYAVGNPAKLQAEIKKAIDVMIK